MEDVRKGKLILVYYSYDPQENEIVVAGKEYADYMGEYADGVNGENGIVYPEYKGEPYNYFSEINDAMWSIDCPENMEGVFDTTGHSLQEIIQKMTLKGFEMIEDNN